MQSFCTVDESCQKTLPSFIMGKQSYNYAICLLDLIVLINQRRNRK